MYRVSTYSANRAQTKFHVSAACKVLMEPPTWKKMHGGWPGQLMPKALVKIGTGISQLGSKWASKGWEAMHPTTQHNVCHTPVGRYPAWAHGSSSVH